LFAIDDTKDPDSTNTHDNNSEPVKKATLTPDKPEWSKAIEYLKGSGTMTEILKKYNLSKEHTDQLIDETL
jgi:hypothetical protein